MANPIDTAHKARWTLLHAESVVGLFVRGNAIPEYFVSHPEIGSPLTKETDDGNGGVVQAFSGGVLTWHPDTGVQLITS